MRTPHAVVLALSVVFTTGCGCSETTKTCPEPGLECCLTDDDCAGGEDYMECCLVTHECIALPDETGEEDDGCDPGYTCSDLLDIVLVQGETAEEGCWLDWSCCAPRDPLSAGKIGTHLGMDVASDGTIWVSGYVAGTDESHLYGDLAGGTYNGEDGRPEWQLLDGVPWDEEPYAPPDGFRGGINVPGDDVGLYTNLDLDSSDVPRIAYHDATNGALRFITRDGGEWNDPVVVDDDGTAGTYGSMVLLDGDIPAVAYRAQSVQMQDYEGTSSQVGYPQSILRYAVADDPAGSSWTTEDVVSTVTPCWGTICPEGHRCRVADGLCWPEDDEGCPDSGGSYSCAEDEACVEDIDDAGVPQGTYGCDEAIVAEPVYDLPEGIGLWNSLALSPDGLPEVVYYDRTRGELVWVASTGAGWADPVILDGDDLSADAADHGDKGWHPSLFIDDTGTRHIAYVDGLAEVLMYMQVDPDGVIVTREVVDDGTREGSADRDIVGDYSSIVVDADGKVRLAYQNTTRGLVMMAVRSETDTWTVSLASNPDAGFMGYYLKQRLVGTTSYLAQFTYNYEMEPYDRGLRVMACEVGADDTVTCM